MPRVERVVKEGGWAEFFYFFKNNADIYFLFHGDLAISWQIG